MFSAVGLVHCSAEHKSFVAAAFFWREILSMADRLDTARLVKIIVIVALALIVLWALFLAGSSISPPTTRAIITAAGLSATWRSHGVIGAVLAMPTTAILKVVYQDLASRRKQAVGG